MCVSVTLGNQNAIRMRNLWSVRLYHIFFFPHYLTQGTIFNKFLNIKYIFDILYKFFPQIFLVIITQRDMIKTVYCFSSCKMSFVGIFSKKYVQNFMKIRPVVAELFHANRRTDMAKSIAAFRNTANGPRNGATNVPYSCRNT